MDQSTSSGVNEGRLTRGPRRLRPALVTSEDEGEFTRALRDYKRQSGRQFPTWSEILEVLRELGYAKRIWRPIGPVEMAAPEPMALGQGFQAIGEDSVTGVLCWFSRVETPSGP